MEDSSELSSELSSAEVSSVLSSEDSCAAAVEPGMTTADIDDLVIAYCEKHNVGASFFEFPGGRYAPDFPGHLCVSINDEVIHGVPDRNRVIMPSGHASGTAEI